MSDKASSQEEQSEEIYEVELIEKKKIETDGKAWYYIKWKDYPGECAFCLHCSIDDYIA